MTIRPSPSSLVVALALAGAAAPSVAATDTEVTLVVERSGLKFTEECTAEVFRADGPADASAEPQKIDDVTRPFMVGNGRHHVVVTCPSTEGPLARSVEVNAKGRPLTVPLKLEPAFLVATVMREGSEVPSDVSVFDERNRKVASGRHKVVIPVPPGKLVVRARVDKSVSGKKRVILGEAPVTTTADKKSALTIDTSDGTLLLTLTSNKKPVNGVGVLRIPGTLDRVADVTAGEDAPVPPGTYDLVSQLYESHDFHEIVTRNVVISSKKSTKVKLDHPTGELDVKIVKDKAPLPDGDKLEIDLYLGAAPKPFNTIARGEVAKLAPGTFRARARVLGKTWDDGSPVEGEAEIKVRPGARNTVTIDLTPARFTVTTTVGKTAKPLDVHVFLPGAQAPLARKTADVDGKASFTLPGGRYVVRAILTASQGELIVEKPQTLVAGKDAALAIDLDVGTATVQVFEKSIAVAAEVLFTKEGDKEPMLTLPAGREAFLPPATYTLQVRRKGVIRDFAPIKVASGRTIERQLDLAAPPPAEEGKAEPMPAGDATTTTAATKPDAKQDAKGDAKGDAKKGAKGDAKKEAKGEAELPEGDDVLVD